jgi:hypothetical protein
MAEEWNLLTEEQKVPYLQECEVQK